MIRLLPRLFVALAAIQFAVSAGTNGFTAPVFRGQAGATYAGWENFTVATNNGTGNVPDLPNPTAADARLVQLDPNAIVTGSGNIYNMPAVSVFEIRYRAAAPIETLVFQARSVGTEIDYASFGLEFDLGSGPIRLTATRTELLRSPVPGLGDAVSSLWSWDLTTVSPAIQDITIKFNAAGSSLSFDSATLDVQSVPEPGAASLLAAGLGALALRRWTFRRR
jgi:PEP-CTERM motif